MKLPREKILQNSYSIEELNILLDYAEQALKEWKPIWSPFVSAQLREEIINKFKDLNDISCIHNGGYSNAERQRICFVRCEKETLSNDLNIPIKGLNIKGNFLFERARPDDFRKAIEDLGINSGSIGDLWLIRDRGAQAMCSQECANLLDKKKSHLRDVEITIQEFSTNEMEIPFQRVEKIIHTVEASKRVDAVASAGFGLSRSKITTQIKQGYLRVNWLTNYQTSKSINTGDIIHLERKGSLKILNIEKTKKERWKIKLLRQ